MFGETSLLHFGSLSLSLRWISRPVCINFFMFFFKGKRISKCSFQRKRVFLDDPFYLFFMKRKFRTVLFIVFVKKNMSKYYLLSVFITNVAVVAILTAIISAAHPGSPPPDRTASGQRFATAAFLVSLHGLWPDIRVCTLSG